MFGTIDGGNNGLKGGLNGGLKGGIKVGLGMVASGEIGKVVGDIGIG